MLPLPLRQHAAHSLAPDQEAAQRVLPPHRFELRLADLERPDHGVVADIAADEVQCSLLAGFVQQAGHVLFACRVGNDRLSVAASLLDFADYDRKARRCASCDDDPQALLGEAACERRTKPGRRSHTHHNGRLHAHDKASLVTIPQGPRCLSAMWSRHEGEASKNDGLVDIGV